MALERYLLRSPRHVHPPGNVGLCTGQATFPRTLWTPPCQGPSEGFRVTRPAGGNVPKRCRSRLPSAAGGGLHLPVLGRACSVAELCCCSQVVTSWCH